MLCVITISGFQVTYFYKLYQFSALCFSFTWSRDKGDSHQSKKLLAIVNVVLADLYFKAKTLLGVYIDVTIYIESLRSNATFVYLVIPLICSIKEITKRTKCNGETVKGMCKRVYLRYSF